MRATQMATRYSWINERAGPFRWRRRGDPRALDKSERGVTFVAFAALIGGGETVGDLRRGAARGFASREATMNKLITLAFAAGFGLALAGCGGSGGDTIKFGIGGPITGSDAAFGSQLKMGAEQAIADIQRGRRDSRQRKFSFTIGDDVADPSKASRSPTSSPPTA